MSEPTGEHLGDRPNPADVQELRAKIDKFKREVAAYRRSGRREDKEMADYLERQEIAGLSDMLEAINRGDWLRAANATQPYDTEVREQVPRNIWSWVNRKAGRGPMLLHAASPEPTVPPPGFTAQECFAAAGDQQCLFGVVSPGEAPNVDVVSRDEMERRVMTWRSLGTGASARSKVAYGPVPAGMGVEQAKAALTEQLKRSASAAGFAAGEPEFAATIGPRDHVKFNDGKGWQMGFVKSVDRNLVNGAYVTTITVESDKGDVVSGLSPYAVQRTGSAMFASDDLKALVAEARKYPHSSPAWQEAMTKLSKAYETAHAGLWPIDQEVLWNWVKQQGAF